MGARKTSTENWEPLGLDEAKKHLRINSDREDDLIDALIKAARISAENYTNSCIVLTEVEETLMGIPTKQELFFGPNASDVTLSYLDVNDEEANYPSEQILKDINANPVEVYFNESVIASDKPASIKLRYTCGYASAAVVPQTIKQAMLLTIGYLFENREDSVQKLPQASERLLEPHRVIRWRV